MGKSPKGKQISRKQDKSRKQEKSRKQDKSRKQTKQKVNNPLLDFSPHLASMEAASSQSTHPCCIGRYGCCRTTYPIYLFINHTAWSPKAMAGIESKDNDNKKQKQIYASKQTNQQRKSPHWAAICPYPSALGRTN